MSRPTPVVTLSESDVTALKTIMGTNPEGSSHFKRAAVLLACAEGKRGKDIAKECHITPNMVIHWRRKFENGGVEGLMSDAPRTGKRVTSSTSAAKQSKKAQQDADAKESSAPVQQYEGTHIASNPLENTQSETTSTVSDTIMYKLQEKRVQIIGLFLSVTVQILALVLLPLNKESIFPKGKRITVNTGSTQSQQEVMDDDEGFELASTLRALPSLTPRDDGSATEEAIDFIETLKDSLKETGAQLYLVLNAPDPASLVQEQSIIGMQLSSREDFKATASLWFHALVGGNHWATNLFSKHIARLLDTAPANCAPLSWLVTSKNYRQHQESSSNILSSGENKVSILISYNDSTGATKTCSVELSNAIPNSKDIDQCTNIYDYQRLVGELEQGIVTGIQKAGSAFMTEILQDRNSKDQKKSRNIEIETMLGRIRCQLPSVIDTSLLHSRSRLYTPELVALSVELSQNMSYGKVAAILNRVQHRPNTLAFNKMTIDNTVVSWGSLIHQEQLNQAKQALLDFGFDPETGKVQPGVSLPTSLTNPIIPEAAKLAAMAEFTRVLTEYEEKFPGTPINIPEIVHRLECPDYTVTLMIDDISVKRQKEERCRNGKEGRKTAKTVINTIIWIRSPEGVYTIAAENTKQGLLMALGFLLKNHLLENRHLVVFFDGAKVIRTYVEEIFSFHTPLKFYLDWYHVCKRISENLSMGLKCGKENRERNEELIKEILKKIWFDQIDKAIDILESIDTKMIRTQKKIDDTIRYLNDRRPYLYNYAARKITGLINSSNRVEDLNDQIVARRQKNKGMSWSALGSRGLAALTTLNVNDELEAWISYGTVRFSPKPVQRDSNAVAI